MQLAVLIEMEALLDTVIASIVAGVGLTTVFSIAIWGAAAYVDYSGDNRWLAAAFAATVGIVGLFATLAIAVFGLIVMISD